MNLTSSSHRFRRWILKNNSSLLFLVSRCSKSRLLWSKRLFHRRSQRTTFHLLFWISKGRKTPDRYARFWNNRKLIVSGAAEYLDCRAYTEEQEECRRRWEEQRRSGKWLREGGMWKRCSKNNLKSFCSAHNFRKSFFNELVAVKKVNLCADYMKLFRTTVASTRSWTKSLRYQPMESSMNNWTLEESWETEEKRT